MAGYNVTIELTSPSLTLTGQLLGEDLTDMKFIPNDSSGTPCTSCSMPVTVNLDSTGNIQFVFTYDSSSCTCTGWPDDIYTLVVSTGMSGSATASDPQVGTWTADAE